MGKESVLSSYKSYPDAIICHHKSSHSKETILESDTQAINLLKFSVLLNFTSWKWFVLSILKELPDYLHGMIFKVQSNSHVWLIMEINHNNSLCFPIVRPFTAWLQPSWYNLNGLWHFTWQDLMNSSLQNVNIIFVRQCDRIHCRNEQTWLPMTTL